jgi:hypothetical protein
MQNLGSQKVAASGGNADSQQDQLQLFLQTKTPQFFRVRYPRSLLLCGHDKGAVHTRDLMFPPTRMQELLAGGVAGGLAKTVVSPLERTKILYQVGRCPEHWDTCSAPLVSGYLFMSIHERVAAQTRRLGDLGVGGILRHLWATEGVVGLFRGNSASVLRIVPYAAIHFRCTNEQGVTSGVGGLKHQ